MNRIMKALKNISGTTKKLTVVFIGFVLMALTVNGQFSVHNIQLGKILLSSEYTGSTTNRIANEETMSMENWMTDYKSWNINNSEKNNLSNQENEKAMKVESWMLKSFNDKTDVFTDPVENNTKVESWMLDMKDWSVTKKCK